MVCLVTPYTVLCLVKVTMKLKMNMKVGFDIITDR